MPRKGRGAQRQQQQHQSKSNDSWQPPLPTQQQRNDPSFQRYMALVKEASDALQAREFRRALSKQVEAVLAAPSVWDELRWAMFCQYYAFAFGTDHHDSSSITESDRMTIQERLVENEKEPILYRAHSAFMLAKYAFNADDEAAAGRYSQRCLSLIRQLSVSEGRRQMLNMLDPSSLQNSANGSQYLSPQNDTIQVILGKLSEKCQQLSDWINNDERIAQKHENERRYQEDPSGYILNVFQKTGMSKEASEEYMKHFLSSGGPGMLESCMEPPKITSDLINQIRALPEKDVVWFVRKDGTSGDADAEVQQQLYEFMENGGRKNTETYRVFTVDQERLNAGSTNAKKIFTMISVTLCDPAETRPKHLLSVFCKACVQPSCFNSSMAGVKKVAPYRPRTILFETTEDATHPHMTSFLRMMGMSNNNNNDEHHQVIGVLETAAQDLLRRKEQEVKNSSTKGAIDAKEMPHVSDLYSGTACGNCKKTGPTLKKCSCGKVYYCNVTCQRAQWKAHKKEHDDILAKKEKKKSAG